MKYQGSQFCRRQFRHRDRFQVLVIRLRDRDGYVGLIESRDLIVVRRGGIGLVRRTVS
jgi:hypothetical protein